VAENSLEELRLSRSRKAKAWWDHIILLCCCPDLRFVTRKLASFKLIGIEFGEGRVMAHSFSVRGSSLSLKLRGCHKVGVMQALHETGTRPQANTKLLAMF
jgi:hypothetical protein